MNKIRFFPIVALMLATTGVQAETADRSKPIEIQAHSFQGDEVKQVAVYSGAVEVHQGTLEILGDKLRLTVSPEGWRTLVVTGNPVKIRERRDPKRQGIEEWVHASALKAVYVEKDDTITLTDLAKLARSENGLVKDSTSGSRIVYNMRTARSYVDGGEVSGKKTRVSTVLAPRQKNTKDTPRTRNVPLESTTTLKE